RRGHPYIESQTKSTSATLANTPDGTSPHSQSLHRTRRSHPIDEAPLCESLLQDRALPGIELRALVRRGLRGHVQGAGLAAAPVGPHALRARQRLVALAELLARAHQVAHVVQRAALVATLVGDVATRASEREPRLAP